MKRREFVRSAAIGAAAAGAACSNTVAPTPHEMTYTILGKTNLRVSRLSYGSHLKEANINNPAERDRQIQYAITKGVNLFDIYDHSYHQYEPMSKSLQGHNDVMISLYMTSTSVEEMVDEVLALFQRDAIDLYRAMYEPEKLDGLIRMREKGKVKAVGVAHHIEEEFCKCAKEYGDDLDYLMFPYNFVHNKATPKQEQNSYAAFLRLAKEHNYGLIGMKPFANEMLLDFARENGYVGGPKDKGICLGSAAIRYALRGDVIHTSLPAMNSIREIDENLAGVYNPELNNDEIEVLEEIDQLAMEHKWAYLNRKPHYRWLAQWAQRGGIA